MINGPIPYSADADFVMGKVPELDNYYVATGFLYGIAAGGGAGKMMAEWILEGRPSLDLWPLDVRRFSFHHTTHHFMGSRMVELYAHHYKLAAPGTEHVTARGVKRSPLHDSLSAQGAVFGSRGGWERPNWFAPDWRRGRRPAVVRRAELVRHVGEEHRAVRERVALIDQTSFAKFEITGPGALDAVQWLSVADMDKPVGTVTYTQLCNERGGIECDLTMTRTRRTALVRGHRLGVRRTRHGLDPLATRPTTAACMIRDLTSAQRRDQPVRPDGARRAASGQRGRRVERGVPLRDGTRASPSVPRRCWRCASATSASSAGSCTSPRRTPHTSTRLLQAAGQAARHRQRRLSRDRHHAHGEGLPLLVDRHHPRHHARGRPGSAGGSTCARATSAGASALAAQREAGVTRKLCTFTLEEMAYPVSGEAIIVDETVVGFTTSANFGHTVGKPIAYGYLPVELPIAPTS